MNRANAGSDPAFVSKTDILFIVAFFAFVLFFLILPLK